MINFLRKNYSLTLWVTRLCLGASIVFAQFFYIDSIFAMYSQSYLGFNFAGLALSRTFAVYAVYGLLSFAIAEVIIRLLSRVAFNYMKIVMIPFNEFVILFMMATVVKNVLVGLLNLLFLITPVVSIWGNVLFDFVVGAIVYFALFLILKKFYLNDKNTPYIFKVGCIIYFAMAVFNLMFFVGGVL